MKLRSAFPSLAALVLSIPSLELVHLVVGAPVYTALQNILMNTDRSPLYGYPTDLTRGIMPLPVHSHNDYWRDIPFYTALAAGCISIEADVWLYNDTLLHVHIWRQIGHDQSSLTTGRTLQSLYIYPILEVLQRQNPRTIFVSGPTKNGVFDTDPSQTLYLFIDLKTPGSETWPRVVEALRPLRDAGYLTSLRNNRTLIPGPVTVIGTGNTPLNLVAPVADRDYFIDGQIGSAAFADLTSYIAPLASTSFRDTFGTVNSDTDPPLNGSQLATLRDQIAAAKSKGIGVRYWETPDWPIRKRNEIWRTLLREGVALLNANDLDAVGEFF